MRIQAAYNALGKSHLVTKCIKYKKIMPIILVEILLIVQNYNLKLFAFVESNVIFLVALLIVYVVVLYDLDG